MFVNGPIVLANSTKDHGQPCVIAIGVAIGILRALMDEVDVEPVDRRRDTRGALVQGVDGLWLATLIGVLATGGRAAADRPDVGLFGPDPAWLTPP